MIVKNTVIMTCFYPDFFNKEHHKSSESEKKF